MQQPALFLPSNTPPLAMGMPSPALEVLANAAELDLGYEGAFPFLTEPDGSDA